MRATINNAATATQIQDGTEGYRNPPNPVRRRIGPRSYHVGGRSSFGTEARSAPRRIAKAAATRPAIPNRKRFGRHGKPRRACWYTSPQRWREGMPGTAP